MVSLKRARAWSRFFKAVQQLNVKAQLSEPGNGPAGERSEPSTGQEVAGASVTYIPNGIEVRRQH